MKVRIREALSLFDFESGTYRAPALDEYLDSDDPFVKAHQWAFATDDELAVAAAAAPVTEVIVEAASAEPGTKRRRGRPAKEVVDGFVGQ